MKKLIITTMLVLGFVAVTQNVAAAHDEPHEAPLSSPEFPMIEAEAQLAGLAEAYLVHGHLYSCSGIAGYNTICVDPTTGFGPILYMCSGLDCNFWGVALHGACLQNTADHNPPSDIFYNSMTSWDPYNIAYQPWYGIGLYSNTCGPATARAWMSQTDYTNVSYIISAYPGFDWARWVH